MYTLDNLTPMVAFCKTIVYHNQDTDIDIIHISYLYFSNFTCTYVYVYAFNSIQFSIKIIGDPK